jgi:large subunit ribosomal protein L18
VSGTADRPRLSVARSLNNVYVQIVDDVAGKTIIGIGSSSKLMKELLNKDDNKTTVALKVGEKAAELAKEQGIESVVFDRNQFLYHGRVKAVADGARKGGMKF